MGDDMVVVESEEQARTIIGERERERQRAQMADQVNRNAKPHAHNACVCSTRMRACIIHNKNSPGARQQELGACG